jgi:hypothetical protein
LKLQKDFLYLPNTAAYAAEIIMAFRFSAVFQFSVQLTFVKRESHPPTPKQLQLYKAIHSPLSVRFLTKIVLILTQKREDMMRDGMGGYYIETLSWFRLN